MRQDGACGDERLEPEAVAAYQPEYDQKQGVSVSNARPYRYTTNRDGFSRTPSQRKLSDAGYCPTYHVSLSVYGHPAKA
jgi:hypothetical protein